MNRPAGGNSGADSVRGAGFAAAKGAALIAVAVIIGIVLLQQVDSGKSTRAGATGSTTTRPRTTTTIKHASTTTRSSTLAQAPVKTPGELSVIVLNGGAPQGAAGLMRQQLLGRGYTNQPQPNNWNGHDQQGNAVMCRAALQQEAVALAVAVGQGTQVQDFPTPAPPFSDGVDCVVVVGSSSVTSTTTSTTTSSTG